jgi:hypothetical protein
MSYCLSIRNCHRPLVVGLASLRFAAAIFPLSSAATVTTFGGGDMVSILPSAPDGSLSGSSMAGEITDDVLDGFSYGANLGGTYNSNVTQSPGGSFAPVESDFFLTLGGRLKYLSKSSGWTFGGVAGASYDAYFNNSDFSGLNYDAKGMVSYQGGPLNLSLESGVSMARGSNSYYSSSFAEILTTSTTLTGRYSLSPKTTHAGNIGQTYTSANSSFNDTESFDAGAAMLWRYSPLTEFGPGLRYSYRTGSEQTGRSAIGPTLNLNYKLSTKVMLNSRVGVDFPSYEEGGSVDPTFAAAIGVKYEASALWGMDFSFYRDTLADQEVAGSFTQLSSVRLGYHRKIRRATLNLDASYELSSFDTTSQAPALASGREDRKAYALGAALSMPVFYNRCTATVFARYGDQNGAAFETWDAAQFGFILGRKF